MTRYHKFVRPRGVDSAKVIQVIETRALRGVGTEEDMSRDLNIPYQAIYDSLIHEKKDRSLRGLQYSYNPLVCLNTSLCLTNV